MLAFAAVALAVPCHASVYQSFPGPYVITGGGSGVTLVDTSNDANDWITANGFNGGATGTLYIGFTMNVTNNNSNETLGGMFGGLQLYTLNDEDLGVGNNWSSVNWSFYNGPGNGDLNANPGLGGANAISAPESARLVVRLNYNTSATGDETATVWFNPNPGASEALQDAGITTSLNSSFDAVFDNIRLRTGNGTASSTFSDIIIASDFGSAVPVPEPSTVLLLLVGATLAVVGLRRRG
jgi:hypothetical protein